jgi:hypothetical protein
MRHKLFSSIDDELLVIASSPDQQCSAQHLAAAEGTAILSLILSQYNNE